MHCWEECKLGQPLLKKKKKKTPVWRFLKKLNIELSYNPVITLNEILAFVTPWVIQRVLY